MPTYPRDTSAPDSMVGQAGMALAELTRPSDANPYAIGDAITTATSSPALLTLTGMGRINGGKGRIRYAKISTDQLANVAVYRVHLFTVANPFIPNDNATVSLRWADRATYLGALPDFAAVAHPGGPGDDVAFAQQNLDFLYQCASADNKLYLLLQTMTAFTPGNPQKFHFMLRMELY